jgi:transposase InsO family protein
MFPSVAPVRRSGSTARRNAKSRAVATRGTADGRYHRAGSAIRSLWLSQDCWTVAPGGLGDQRQAGRAYLATRGAQSPSKQPRGRLWLADGSCIRLRPQHRGHVWSYDFVEDRTHDGRRYRVLNVLDEFTHECLAIRVARRPKAIDVIDVLSDLLILRGIPGHIRSDKWA